MAARNSGMPVPSWDEVVSTSGRRAGRLASAASTAGNAGLKLRGFYGVALVRTI